MFPISVDQTPYVLRSFLILTRRIDDSVIFTRSFCEHKGGKGRVSTFNL
jgi:hypothetical protein